MWHIVNIPIDSVLINRIPFLLYPPLLFSKVFWVTFGFNPLLQNPPDLLNDIKIRTSRDIRLPANSESLFVLVEC